METNPPGTVGGSDSDGGDPDRTTVVLAGANVTAGTFFNVVPGAIPPRTVFCYCTTPFMVNALRDLPQSAGTWRIVSVSKPARGRVTIRPDGFVLYQPRANFIGKVQDSFVVTITDDAGATVQKTILVKASGSVAGRFQGFLIEDGGNTGAAAAVEPADARVTIVLGANAAYTASVNLRGETVRVSGQLAGPLRSEKNIRLSGGRKARMVLVYDDVTDAWNVTITGDISYRSITPIRRAVKKSALRSERFTSTFLPAGEFAGQPQVGFSTMKVGTSGSIRIAGRMAGGGAFTTSSLLRGDGTATFYLAPKTSTLAGTLSFTDEPASPTGVLEWRYSAPDSSGAITTVRVPLSVKGSEYVKPRSGASILGAPSNRLRYALNESGVSSTMPVDTSAQARAFSGQAADGSFAFTVNPGSGLTTGYRINAATRVRAAVHGVVLQSDSTALGITGSEADPMATWQFVPAETGR